MEAQRPGGSGRVTFVPQRPMADARPNRMPPKILCPRCGEVTAWSGNPWRPFCSERCKMIDLGAWASEDYKIAGKPDPNLLPEDGGEQLLSGDDPDASREN